MKQKKKAPVSIPEMQKKLMMITRIILKANLKPMHNTQNITMLHYQLKPLPNRKNPTLSMKMQIMTMSKNLDRQ